MRGRPRKGKREATRDRILDIAARLFADHGYSATSMRDVARRAHIRVSSPYYYFRSKEMLYQAVLAREQDRVHAIMTDALREASDLPDQLGAMFLHAFDYHMKNPTFLKLALRSMLGEGGQPPYDLRWTGILEGLLESRHKTGKKVPDPALFVVTAGGAITHNVLSLHRRSDGSSVRDHQKDLQRTRQHVVEVLLRCLGFG